MREGIQGTSPDRGTQGGAVVDRYSPRLALYEISWGREDTPPTFSNRKWVPWVSAEFWEIGAGGTNDHRHRDAGSAAGGGNDDHPAEARRWRGQRWRPASPTPRRPGSAAAR